MSKEDVIFRFRERAAIRQFEANQTHYLAGFQAANELRKDLAAKSAGEIAGGNFARSKRGW